ncbi:hypothetical protein [Clostridium gasigenes]|uniref:hypothetical protein n=1 Tax=Clostridium gasigenes TaxID=94869 RepID=UPI001C0D9A88|nr:hypothetical protein [Clostridium gasigenes]MBU3107980.1 hypothetical protein [Clostridium gasigenes]
MHLISLSIEYGEDIIVVIKFFNRWEWYATEKGYWYLDLPKLENAYLEKGHKLYNQGDYSDRFDIRVLDEDSADIFWDKISEFRADKNELSELIVESEKNNTSSSNRHNLMKLYPTLLVDFDELLLLSAFSETTSFENYVPDGWTGKYERFLEKLPTEERYWIINGRNYFRVKR